MAARYHQTPLPVKLDISRTDTAEQLKPKSFSESTKVNHESTKESLLQRELNDACIDVVRRSVEEYSSQHRFTQSCPPDIRDYESWLRHFHAEYDDRWYAKNHDRLTRSFHPIWSHYFDSLAHVSTLSANDAGLATKSSSSAVVPDLLG
jgi:hypothetical protein